MKVLLAIECGGHPLWQRNKYEFVMLDIENETARRLSFDSLFTEIDHNWHYGEVEYYIREDGVYAQFFSCGSGFGKIQRGAEFMILGRSEYDKCCILRHPDRLKSECFNDPDVQGVRENPKLEPYRDVAAGVWNSKDE